MPITVYVADVCVRARVLSEWLRIQQILTRLPCVVSSRVVAPLDEVLAEFGAGNRVARRESDGRESARGTRSPDEKSECFVPCHGLPAVHPATFEYA